MSDRDQRIRERAHQIWEAEGRPHGRDREHWERAASEVEAASLGPDVPGAPDEGGPRRPVKRRTVPRSSPPAEELTAEAKAGRSVGAGAARRAGGKAGPEGKAGEDPAAKSAAPPTKRGRGKG